MLWYNIIMHEGIASNDLKRAARGMLAAAVLLALRDAQRGNVEACGWLDAWAVDFERCLCWPAEACHLADWRTLPVVNRRSLAIHRRACWCDDAR